MSLETTLARADKREAMSAWNRHRYICAGCTTGARRRDRAGMCGTGIALRANVVLATAELERQHALDEAPTPGQGELFPISSVH